MEFDEWEPVYEAILADFGFDRAADERARDRLCERCRSPTDATPGDGDATATFDPDSLTLAGKSVAVVGAAPSLDTVSEAERAAAADAVLAASTAVDVLAGRGVDVDLMVTDLDKNPETAVAVTRSGTPVAVHAHGDNLPAVERWVPEMDREWLVPTTQAAPVGVVRNFGGFTDGDRAAFLADHFGAAELTFVGWDFDDPTVDPMKRRKLRWAERLLCWLERRRGERFALLDGRREDVDTTALPG